jgi:hypothetical protein
MRRWEDMRRGRGAMFQVELKRNRAYRNIAVNQY